MDQIDYNLGTSKLQQIITAIRVSRGPGNMDRARILDKIQEAAKKNPTAKTFEFSLTRTELRAVKVGILTAWDDLTTEGCLTVRGACQALRIWNKGVEPLVPKMEEEKEKLEDLLDEDPIVQLDD